MPEEAEADIVISSELKHHEPLAADSSDPRLAAGFAGRVLHPPGAQATARDPELWTQSSDPTLGCGMDHAVDRVHLDDQSTHDDAAAVVFRGARGPANPAVL